MTAETGGLAPASPSVIAEGDGAAAPPNPLRDPRDRRIPRVAGPCVLVMFGVTGDLARKKLMPAVYDLANRGLLPPGFSLVGFARRDWADEDFAQITHQAVKEYARTPFRDAVWEQLSEGVRFVSGSFSDDAAFDELAECVRKIDAERGTGGNTPSSVAFSSRALARSWPNGFSITTRRQPCPCESDRPLRLSCWTTVGNWLGGIDR